ncbi:hypothetical protein [Flagellimonas sp.]|jgi:hypothetical protein|uniref:hypothetical protein n=1 Tax=Flagellimonas sp. TaxID=2058762 RepID=UPI003BAB0AA5
MKLYLNLAIFLLYGLNCSSQSNNINGLDKVYDPNRIEPLAYKLVMFNTTPDSISSISILERKISFEKYKGRDCVKISETNHSGKNKTTTISYMDQHSLAPVCRKEMVNDSLIQIQEIKGNRVFIYNALGKQINDVEKPKDAYLSNAFSELVQSNDFNKHPNISFSTFRPGKPKVGRFVARMVQEEKIKFVYGEVQCLIIQFVKLAENGEEIPAGYRYIDKTTGKVLAFKTNLNSNTYFMYQILFF